MEKPSYPIVKKQKSRGRKNQVVLGLRATPEQKAFLTAAAKARGIPLQSYFEQIMMEHAPQAWIPRDHVTITIHKQNQRCVELLTRLLSSNRSEHIETVLQSLQALVNGKLTKAVV